MKETTLLPRNNSQIIISTLTDIIYHTILYIYIYLMVYYPVQKVHEYHASRENSHCKQTINNGR